MGKRPKKKDLQPPRPQDIATKAQPFIERIEFVDEEKAEKNAQYAEEKKIIVEEAERAGIQPKALRAILRRRKAIRAERDALEKLDIDEKAQWERLADVFGNTPFGEHARSLASMMRSGEVSLSLNYADGRSTEGQFVPDHRPDEDNIARFAEHNAAPAGDEIDELAR